MELNFVIGGMLGDFIQSLFAVKNICLQQNAKANIYLTDKYGGDGWSYGLEKAYHDLHSLVILQSYVNRFELAPSNIHGNCVNLNTWRTPINGFIQCWSEMLFSCYHFSLTGKYQWININKIDDKTKDKILIHKSTKRHNADFNWDIIFDNIDGEKLFITSSEKEWDTFSHKNKTSLYLVLSIEDMALAINSCRYFIGNQSAPFAIASALDIPRLVELDKWGGSVFYKGEERYSNNISWILNNSEKYISYNSLIYGK